MEDRSPISASCADVMRPACASAVRRTAESFGDLRDMRRIVDGTRGTPNESTGTAVDDVGNHRCLLRTLGHIQPGVGRFAA